MVNNKFFVIDAHCMKDGKVFKEEINEHKIKAEEVDW